MTNLEILTKARAAIATPEQWCQNIRHSGLAYCALGAIDCALGDSGYGSAAEKSPATALLAAVLRPEERERSIRRLREVFEVSGRPSNPSLVAQFNNSSSHAEVLAIFDRAIERCRMINGMASAEAMAHELADA